MNIDINVYKVFTDQPDFGNSAGVLEYNSMWSVEDMLQIANHSDTSVTVFVKISKNDVQDYKFRFFSKEKELSFCGHGSLAGAAYAMNKLGVNLLRVKFGTSNSIVIIESKDGIYYLKTPRTTILEISPIRDEIAFMLGIEPEAISTTSPFCVATIGSPKLLVPIISRMELNTIKPKYTEIKKWSRDNNINGIYTYAFKEKLLDQENNLPKLIYTRGFNPLFGILEDPATGVAAGALADVLYIERGYSSFIFHQGELMGASSQIRVEIEPEGVRIGGSVLLINTSIKSMKSVTLREI
ncbi:PhzF family phenazine biosynthesis protein [Paenibacillus sp. DS2015]|uniref:PhzF family phenazine biosynthesis protein n=1 Tax=Paenibacillus sp. DS2015 TaxID=3373917 RepID=UPI003D1D9E70